MSRSPYVVIGHRKVTVDSNDVMLVTIRTNNLLFKNTEYTLAQHGSNPHWFFEDGLEADEYFQSLLSNYMDNVKQEKLRAERSMFITKAKNAKR